MTRQAESYELSYSLRVLSSVLQQATLKRQFHLQALVAVKRVRVDYLTKR